MGGYYQPLADILKIVGEKTLGLSHLYKNIVSLEGKWLVDTESSRRNSGPRGHCGNHGQNKRCFAGSGDVIETGTFPGSLGESRL